VRAPCDGIVFGRRAIGDLVQKGEVIANVDSTSVHATLNGVLRGLIHDDIPVKAGLKIADIDPRADARHCYSISDKALAIGGGALEAALWLMRQI
jgi:xanthine dehydrogenase accessory factor